MKTHLILTTLLLVIAIAVLAVERDPRLHEMQSFTYNNGWVQNGYSTYEYNESNQIDYYLNFTGSVGSFTPSIRSEYSYDYMDRISEVVNLTYTNGTWVNQSKMVYEHNDDGYQTTYSYSWTGSFWNLTLRADYLWANQQNYRINYYTVTDGVTELSMYYLNSFNPAGLISEDEIYSNIPYYGGWVVTSRRVYMYQNGLNSQLISFATDFVNGGEYESSHGYYYYNDSSDLDEIVFNLITNGVTEPWARYLYLYEEVGNIDEHQIAVPELVVYPNPCYDSFSVKLSKHSQKIALYDVKGRRVKSITPTNTDVSVDTSDVPAGIYFLKSSNPTISCKKVVVLR